MSYSIFPAFLLGICLFLLSLSSGQKSKNLLSDACKQKYWILRSRKVKSFDNFQKVVKAKFNQHRRIIYT